MRRDKPLRSKSPTQSTQRKNLPSKRPDHGTEEIIRFVREFQNAKQPTLIANLQRKAPLPEIGSTSGIGLNDSGFLDKVNFDYDETYLDDEIVYANKVSDPRNDRKIKEVLTITRQQTRDNLYQSLKPAMNDCFVFSRQQNRNRIKSLQLSKPVVHNNFKRTRQSLKQLPPLYNDDLPDRPTAPSPSRTPPLNNLNNQEDVEFLDLS